jgi:hypothetical protein
LFNVLFFFLSASLSSSLSDDLLAKATVEVVTKLKNKAAKSDMTRTNIQMIGAIRLAIYFALFSPSSSSFFFMLKTVLSLADF